MEVLLIAFGVPRSLERTGHLAANACQLIRKLVDYRRGSARPIRARNSARAAASSRSSGSNRTLTRCRQARLARISAVWPKKSVRASWATSKFETGARPRAGAAPRGARAARGDASHPVEPLELAPLVADVLPVPEVDVELVLVPPLPPPVGKYPPDAEHQYRTCTSPLSGTHESPGAQGQVVELGWHGSPARSGHARHRGLRGWPHSLPCGHGQNGALHESPTPAGQWSHFEEHCELDGHAVSAIELAATKMMMAMALMSVYPRQYLDSRWSRGSRCAERFARAPGEAGMGRSRAAARPGF